MRQQNEQKVALNRLAKPQKAKKYEIPNLELGEVVRNGSKVVRCPKYTGLESALVHVSCNAGKLSLSTRRPPLHTRYITPLFVAADKMMVKFVGGHLETKETARLRIWWQRQVTVDLRRKTRPLRFFLGLSWLSIHI